MHNRRNCRWSLDLGSRSLVLGPWIFLDLGSLVKSCPGPCEDGVILKGQKLDQLLVY